jgi:hypothetical protein
MPLKSNRINTAKTMGGYHAAAAETLKAICVA